MIVQNKTARQRAALLCHPKFPPSNEEVFEAFRSINLESSVIGVKEVSGSCVVRTRLKSVNKTQLNVLLVRFGATDVEITATSRGLLLMFFFKQ